MRPMPPLANASTATYSLRAFVENQRRETAAIKRIVLRAQREGTLGESSPHYGQATVEIKPLRDYRVRFVQQTDGQ